MCEKAHFGRCNGPSVFAVKFLCRSSQKLVFSLQAYRYRGFAYVPESQFFSPCCWSLEELGTASRRRRHGTARLGSARLGWVRNRPAGPASRAPPRRFRGRAAGTAQPWAGTRRHFGGAQGHRERPGRGLRAACAPPRRPSQHLWLFTFLCESLQQIQHQGGGYGKRYPKPAFLTVMLVFSNLRFPLLLETAGDTSPKSLKNFLTSPHKMLGCSLRNQTGY